MGLMSKFSKKKADSDEPIADDATEDSLDEGTAGDEPKKSKGKKSKEKKEKKEKPAAAGGGPKQFFIDHGEKVGLAAVGVCLLLMIWSAVGRERLADDRSPDDLQARANSRQAEIEGSQLPEIAATAGSFPVLMSQGLKSVDPASIVSLPVTPIDEVIAPIKATKRGDPAVLAAEAPLAVAGVGPFAVIKEKDLLGLSFQERERIRREKELEEQQLKEEEQARLLRERRAKEKAERDKKKKTTSRDKKKEQEEAERRARIDESRQPEQTEWPLPAEFAQQGFDPPAEVKDGEIIAAGRYWVVVNALAPRYKQQRLFDEIFLNAVGYNPERDRPDYLGMRIRRLEIPENAGDAPLDWSQAKEWSFVEQVEAMKAEQKSWLGEAQPVISDAFYNPKLTQPLGPLLLQSWEKWAAHPEVMLKGEEVAVAPELDEVPLDTEKEETEPKIDDPFGLGNEAAVEPAEPVRGGRVAPPRGGAPPRGMVEEGFGPQQGGRMNVEVEQLGKFYQVRVFDFTVEPGKRYRYQVRLALRNPNSELYGSQAVSPAFLADPKSQKIPWKETDWSEPTNLAVVPLGREAFAGSVNLPEEDDEFNEAYATVLTRIINFGKGSVTTALFDVYRGGMVSGITEGFEIDPIKKLVRRQDDSLIETDVLLLDMRGGPRTLDEDPMLAIAEGRPAEMLLLDSKGNLHVRSEIDDANEMIKYRMIAGEDVSTGGFNEVIPGVDPRIPIEGVPLEPTGEGEINIFDPPGRRR